MPVCPHYSDLVTLWWVWYVNWFLFTLWIFLIFLCAWYHIDVLCVKCTNVFFFFFFCFFYPFFYFFFSILQLHCLCFTFSAAMQFSLPPRPVSSFTPAFEYYRCMWPPFRLFLIGLEGMFPIWLVPAVDVRKKHLHAPLRGTYAVLWYERWEDILSPVSLLDCDEPLAPQGFYCVLIYNAFAGYRILRFSPHLNFFFTPPPPPPTCLFLSPPPSPPPTTCF